MQTIVYQNKSILCSIARAKCYTALIIYVVDRRKMNKLYIHITHRNSFFFIWIDADKYELIISDKNELFAES